MDKNKLKQDLVSLIISHPQFADLANDINNYIDNSISIDNLYKKLLKDSNDCNKVILKTECRNCKLEESLTSLGKYLYIQDLLYDLGRKKDE